MIIGFCWEGCFGKKQRLRDIFTELQDNIVHSADGRCVCGRKSKISIRQVGAEDQVPLVYGDQDDKVRVFLH